MLERLVQLPNFALAEAWLHDLDPVILPIYGAFAVRYYGLAYILGFLAGYLILRTVAKRGGIALDHRRVIDVMFVLILGVIVGGRVGYAAFYQPSLLWGFTATPPFWDLLALNKGGMASHGGIIGVALAALWTARRERVGFLELGDALALATPTGLLFGRLANFVNGELLGSVVAGPGEPSPDWAVKYPQELTERPGEVLDRLSDAQAFELETLIRQQWAPIEQELRAAGRPAPDGIPAEVVFHRMIAEIQAGNTELAERLAPLLNARHPSQLYQAAAEGLVLFVVLALLWLKPKRAGTLGAAFLITYGVGRIATEFFRLPDVGVPEFLGLSRGQWLSVAMIVGGVVLLGIVHTRKTPRVGGWLHTVGRERRGAEASAASAEDGEASSRDAAASPPEAESERGDATDET